MPQGKCSAVTDIAGTLLAVVIVLPSQRRATGILQRDFESEVVGIVFIEQVFPGYGLADPQLSGIIRRSLLVSNNYGIQQAEQAGKIPSAQIVPVGGVAAAFIQFLFQCIRILFNPSPQKALICGKERIDDLPAVLIVQAVIHHCVDAIVQIHAARGLSSCKLIILPAVQIKRPSLLCLGNRGNVPQRDVDHIIRRILCHGLHQLTNAGHNGDAVIFCACVGVNRIDAHNDRDLCWVQLISHRRRRLFQGVLGVYFRPLHTSIARHIFRRIRSEDQHAVLTIYFGGRTGNGRIVRAGKGKLHPIDALAVLVHFLYAQLPALVGDIDGRAELPLELIGVQEGEIAPFKAILCDVQLRYDLIDYLFGRLAVLDACFDCIGYIGFQSIVKFRGGSPRDAKLR